MLWTDVGIGCDKISHQKVVNYSFQGVLDSIKVYHSDTTKVDQDAMIQELQKPGSQSKLRVLMTTESLALGMDLQDIIQVVIYRFPKNLEPSTLWQRGGRACRRTKRQGHYSD
jgi:ATP-dependent helicase YprA (DUF1998 family)